MSSIEILSMIRGVGIVYLLLLIAITMHEFGHAYAAYKLGDNLPKFQGRVTLNPIAHMDLLGTIILPLLMLIITHSTGGGGLVFGWGKPVQTSLNNPKTRVRDELLATGAGVGMNLVVAFISAIIAAICTVYDADEIAKVANLSMLLNCMLFTINMLPIPPLDGSHFLKHAIKMSDVAYMNFSRWGFMIMLMIIMIPQLREVLALLISLVALPFLWLENFVVNIFV